MRGLPRQYLQLKKLLKFGAKVFVCDPKAMEKCKRNLWKEGKRTVKILIFITFKDADLCVIMSEWNEFKEIYDKFKLRKIKLWLIVKRSLIRLKPKNIV